MKSAEYTVDIAEATTKMAQVRVAQTTEERNELLQEVQELAGPWQGDSAGKRLWNEAEWMR